MDSNEAEEALELERIKLERERLALERARFEAEQAAQSAPKPPKKKAGARPRSNSQRARPTARRARGGRSGSPPFVWVGVGVGALALLVVGALVASSGGSEPDEPEVADVSQPAEPEVVDADPVASRDEPVEAEPPVKAKSPDSAPAPTDGVREILAQASACEEREEYGRAYALLEAYEREHGKADDVVFAQKQLLTYCRSLVQSETSRAARLQQQGRVDEARALLEALAAKLPPQLARGVRASARQLAAPEATPERGAKPGAAPKPVARAEPEAVTGETESKPAVGEVESTAKPDPDPWWDDNTSTGPFADARSYKSKYYLIRTNVQKPYAKRYMKMLDRYFKRYLSVFKDFLPAKRYERAEIWIYATQDEFMRAEEAPRGTGGYYEPGKSRVVAYHGRFGRTGTTQTVLAHEATHQFEDLALDGKLFNAPIWIIEGLAVLFESAAYDGRKVDIGKIPHDRLAALKRGLEADALIPLRDLIRTPQPQFTGYHYAHAWAIIYRVLFSSESAKVRKRNQRWFSDLFAAALNGPVSHHDVIRAIGGHAAFAEFERTWKQWLRDLPYDFEPK